MELKQIGFMVGIRREQSINRTFMELKLNFFAFIIIIQMY